nr:mutS protein homolog 4-like [Megalopta genalis]
MNVMRTDMPFRPPRGRPMNQTRTRDQQPFAVPFPTEYQSKLNTNNRPATNWRSTSSSYSRSSNRGRSVGRTRGSTSSFLAAGSRNYASRSGKSSKTTPAIGSSTIESGGVIVAVTSGRGDARAEVGMAALDIRCPHLILCQICDSQTYTNTLTKLYVFDPIQVLMPDTMCERVADRNILHRLIVDKFPEMQPTPISRMHFNDTIGLERLRTLCAAEYSSVELFVKHKYYALAAAAALLKYVEFSHLIIYSPRSMRIEFQGSPNATSIDLESARSLELVQSQSGQRNLSLLGILDRCSTPMGRKLLRANILQPLCEERAIVNRQSSIAELVTNRSLRIILQPLVRRLYGADRLAGLSTASISHENSVQCAEQNLNYVLLLKNMLDTVPELERALEDAQTDLLRQIRKRLENPRFRLMRERILETIHPDARFVVGYTSSNMQRCFAIKAGINDLLDIARRTYCELIDDMKSMVDSLASKFKLPLSLGCNGTRGYHIQAIPPRNSSAETWKFPTEFIEVQKSRRAYTMTTTVLTTLSQQCKIASEELHLMSNVLLCDLLQSIQEYIDCLFQLNDDVAELDVISSLAQTSSLHAYVRPTFGSELELLDSRHPVLEAFGIDDPVPNNVSASIPWNFHIISGPNMSGKSTYLKQIVLLHIMAQIGCFVPAKRATFRLTNLIFCKIAVRDDIECNASTFVLEMKEAQYMLRSVTSTSLVVWDELCKGTAVGEGVSIAWAICEWLLHTTAFVFVATHFAYLTRLAVLYCNVTNHSFETIRVRETSLDDEHSHRYTHTHRLKFGVATTNDYGIVLAELTDLPKSVTEQARKYASEERMIAANQISIETNTWEHTCYRIVAKMYQLLEREDGNENSDYRGILADYVEQISNLRIRASNENNEHAEKRIEPTANNANQVVAEATTDRLYLNARTSESIINNEHTEKRIELTANNIDQVVAEATADRLYLNDRTSESTIDETRSRQSMASRIIQVSNSPDRLTLDNKSVENQSEHSQFQNDSSCDRNLDLDERDASRQPSFNSVGSLIFRSSSTMIDNLEFQSPNQFEKTNMSIDTFIDEAAALSQPLTSVSSSLPTHMPLTSILKLSNTNLHEYCLSDSDFDLDVDLRDRSQTFTPSTVPIFEPDGSTDLTI